MTHFAAIVVTAALALAAAPAGLAATASVNGSTLVFQAADAEANNVGVSTGNPLIVSDAAPITAGLGCNPTMNEYVVTCSAAGVSLLDIRTGDLDDRVSLEYAFVAGTIDGGPAHDFLNVRRWTTR